MVKRILGGHPVRYLTCRWVTSLPLGSQPQLAIPMLAEKLSNVRTLIHPDAPWHKVTSGVKDLEYYEDHLESFPQVFRLWLASGDAFEEIEHSYMVPDVRQRFETLPVHFWEIANLLAEGPAPSLTEEVYQMRSLLWWHLCGMPIELLRELTGMSTLQLELTIEGAVENLFNSVGFNLFCWRVDVAGIIGGDSDIPYLKRLLLAGSYIRRPLAKTNSSWKKCILPLYYKDPRLLHRLKNTGTPHVPATLFWTRPRRNFSVPKEKESFVEGASV